MRWYSVECFHLCEPSFVAAVNIDTSHRKDLDEIKNVHLAEEGCCCTIISVPPAIPRPIPANLNSAWFLKVVESGP